MKKNYLHFPEDVKYLVKMVPTSLELKEARIKDTVLTECTLKNTDDGFVTLSAEGFYPASFVDKHFEFLLFTGEIKKVNID
jgi:hypothetical protein